MKLPLPNMKPGEEDGKQKRFRDLLHEAVFANFRANPRGEFLLRNPILLRLLGYKSYDELSAKIRSIDDALPLKPAHIKGLEPLVIDARVPRSFELQSYRPDGSTIWVSGKTRLVHDASGEVCYEGSLMGGLEQEGCPSDEIFAGSQKRWVRSNADFAHYFALRHSRTPKAKASGASARPFKPFGV